MTKGAYLVDSILTLDQWTEIVRIDGRGSTVNHSSGDQINFYFTTIDERPLMPPYLKYDLYNLA